MADVSVRPAVADDAPELARVQVDTWRTAYASILPAAVLDGLDPAQVSEVWAAAITAPPTPQHRVLVALEQQWRVGFLAVGPADDLEADDPSPGTTAAISTLLVEPRWGRRGHGSRLLAAAADLASEDGTTRLITWIPAEDAASQGFLVSAGWAPDGLARALDTGAGELREIRLHTALA